MADHEKTLPTNITRSEVILRPVTFATAAFAAFIRSRFHPPASRAATTKPLDPVPQTMKSKTSPAKLCGKNGFAGAFLSWVGSFT